MQSITFILNGRQVVTTTEPSISLLEVLREQFGIISPKNGCQPQGQCGCCTVLVDGKPRLSCAMPVSKIEGKTVLTCEGLSEEIRSQVSQCFTITGAVQCGFCTPGIVMSTVALVQDKPDATSEDILKALRPHLCRCTGYKKIIEAIELFAAIRKGAPLPEPDCSGKVGTSLPRYSAPETVLGDRKFVDDIFLEGMLFAAPRLSDHPRALVRKIEATESLLIPGVIRVITAEDVPGERLVGLIEKDWPPFVALGDETRYVGDVIAVVVADSLSAARKGAAALEVDYDVRKPVTTPRDALRPNAPKIHPRGNLLSRSTLRRGDVFKALEESAFAVEEVFRTQFIEHLFLEPESCVAVPTENGGLRLYSQGQGVFDDRSQIAAMLGWEEERIEVELIPNGGAFGGKEDMSIQAQTALAACLCNAPVKLTLTREESLRLHPKRHPIEMHYRVGCDSEGKLTAVYARMIGDTGAYASVGAKVLERACGHACGPYRVPNLDIESLAVYTNNPPCGAMRGFGANQAAFAIEGCLDRLAEKVGLDGWEIRWRNALELGDRFATGQKMSKPIGLKKTLLAVKDAYRNARYAGIACGIKNVGIGNGMPDIGKASLCVESDGCVVIRTGYTEMGQGLFTICIQVVCEETGLSPERFRCVVDTRRELDCGQTTASRATVLAGHAVRDAARKLKADLDQGTSLQQLAGRDYEGYWACLDTTAPDEEVPEPKTHLTYGFATQVVLLDDEGKLKKVIAAHDVGRAMNPIQLEGQIEGAIHMGLGYALTEDFIVEQGRIKSMKVRDCGVLRAHHMPEVEVIFIEEPDPECPYGARGVGEIGLVPTAPAVAAALYSFDKTYRSTLPMKDSPAARAILKR